MVGTVGWQFVRFSRVCANAIALPLLTWGAADADNATAAVSVLNAAGYAVHVASKVEADGKHLCCGRTYLSSAMVEDARANASAQIDCLLPFAEKALQSPRT